MEDSPRENETTSAVGNHPSKQEFYRALYQNLTQNALSTHFAPNKALFITNTFGIGPEFQAWPRDLRVCSYSVNAR